MSVRVMSKVFEMSLPPREKFVLLAMADWADERGESVYPSIETLAKKTSYSQTTVKRVLKVLAMCGTIRRNGTRYNNIVSWAIDTSINPSKQDIKAAYIKLDTRVTSHPSDQQARHPSDQQLDTHLTRIHQQPPLIHQDDWPFLDMLIRLTGLMPTPTDIPEIQNAEKSGAIEDDVRAAIQWRADNGKPPVRTIKQILPGVETSRLKRVQGGENSGRNFLGI